MLKPRYKMVIFWADICLLTAFFKYKIGQEQMLYDMRYLVFFGVIFYFALQD
jgi:hypothetical protein